MQDSIAYLTPIFQQFSQIFANLEGLVLGCIKADFCNQIHSIFRDLQENHSFSPLPIQNFSKFSSESFCNFEWISVEVGRDTAEYCTNVYEAARGRPTLQALIFLFAFFRTLSFHSLTFRATSSFLAEVPMNIQIEGDKTLLYRDLKELVLKKRKRVLSRTLLQDGETEHLFSTKDWPDIGQSHLATSCGWLKSYTARWRAQGD